MKNKLVSLACGALGALVAFFFLFLFLTPKISLKAVNLACNGDCGNADTIRVAMELGRLDIVALVLTFLGLLIAVMAIFGFLAVKEKAALQAKDAAESAVKEWLRNGDGVKILGQEVAKLMEINEEQMPDDKANNIMKAFISDVDNEGGES